MNSHQLSCKVERISLTIQDVHSSEPIFNSLVQVERIVSGLTEGIMSDPDSVEEVMPLTSPGSIGERRPSNDMRLPREDPLVPELARHLGIQISEKIEAYLKENRSRNPKPRLTTDMRYGYSYVPNRYIVLRLCRSIPMRNKFESQLDDLAKKTILGALPTNAHFFDYDRWFVGKIAPHGVNWRNDLIDSGVAVFDKQANLTIDGKRFFSDYWAWPEVAWEGYTPTMSAYDDLARLVEKSDRLPLNALVKSGQPYKALALQTIEAIKAVMTKLGPTPK